MKAERSIYGTVAEFDDPTAFVEAAKEVRRRGYRNFDAYSPYPIKDLFKIVPGRNPVAPIVFQVPEEGHDACCIQVCHLNLGRRLAFSFLHEIQE